MGLDGDQVTLTDEIIRTIIEEYTDEEGVRGLKKHLEKILSILNVFLLTHSDASPDTEAQAAPSKAREILPYPIDLQTVPYQISTTLVKSILKKDDKPSLNHLYL